MLGPRNLLGKSLWLPRARLWRLVLLQHDDGSWDPTEGLAAAVLAQHVLPEGVLEEAPGGGFVVVVAGEARGAARRSKSLRAQGGLEGGATQEEMLRKEQCPLTGFAASAFDFTMPDELRALFAAAGAAETARALGEEDPGALARRLWATLVAVSAARGSAESFLLRTEEADGIDETVVCRAMAWVEIVAEGFPALKPRLSRLSDRADAVRAAWEARNEAQVALAREAWSRHGSLRRATDVHRAAGALAEAVCESHETLSAGLSAGATGLRRWQRVVVLCTLILGMLCVVPLTRMPCAGAFLPCFRRALSSFALHVHGCRADAAPPSLCMRAARASSGCTGTRLPSGALPSSQRYVISLAQAPSRRTSPPRHSFTDWPPPAVLAAATRCE